MSDIQVLGQEFDAVFDEQRRAIPKTYNYGNEIRRLSKAAIKATIDGRNDDVVEIVREMSDVWGKLGTLSLPMTFQAFQDFETAQELIEAHASYAMFRAILDGGTMSAVDWESFGPQVFNIIPQAWLFGLLDAGSELSRIINRYIRRNRLSRRQRQTIRERFLAIAEELNDFLDHFSETTPAVMDAYNKYGFRQSFRSKLNQLRGAIEYQERFVLEAIEHED